MYVVHSIKISLCIVHGFWLGVNKYTCDLKIMDFTSTEWSFPHHISPISFINFVKKIFILYLNCLAMQVNLLFMLHLTICQMCTMFSFRKCFTCNLWCSTCTFTCTKKCTFKWFILFFCNFMSRTTYILPFRANCIHKNFLCFLKFILLELPHDW